MERAAAVGVVRRLSDALAAADRLDAGDDRRDRPEEPRRARPVAVAALGARAADRRDRPPSAGGHRHRHPDAGSRRAFGRAPARARRQARSRARRASSRRCRPTTRCSRARSPRRPTVLAVAGMPRNPRGCRCARRRSAFGDSAAAPSATTPTAPRARALRRRADEHRRARSRGGRPRAHLGRARGRSHPPHSAGRERRRHAGAGARDRDDARGAGRAAAAALHAARTRSKASRSATSSRRPKRTAPCASTSRRTTRIASSRRSTSSKAASIRRSCSEKLVLIGVTGVGMVEDKNTPLGRRHAGRRDPRAAPGEPVRRDAARPPAWAPRVEALAFLLLGSLLVVATPRWKPHHAAMLALGGIALAAGCPAILAFRTQRLLFDAATPATGSRAALRHAARADARGGESAEEVARARRAARSARRARASPASSMRRSAIQTATLPRADFLRDDPRVDLAATMIPAREVGGDLYDFFRLDDRRLFFLVGDVAGKGLSASIFMAVSKALYKSTMLRAPGADIGELMSVANAEVSRDNPEMLFVTAFAGDPRSRDRRARLLQRGAREPVPRCIRATRRCAASRTATDRRCARSTTSPIAGARCRMRAGRAALRRHRRRDRGAARRPATCTAASACGDVLPASARATRRRARGRRRAARRRGSVRRRRRAGGRPHGAGAALERSAQATGVDATA